MKAADDYAAGLGPDGGRHARRSMDDVDRLSSGVVQKRDAGKVAVTALAAGLERTVPDVARIVGRREAERNAMPELLAGLKTLIDRWRRL